MDEFVHIKSQASGEVRAPYPIGDIKSCGDEWCVNGPPGPKIETYFLCPECEAKAPDAILLGYAVKPSKLKPGDRRKINASVMCSFITFRNKNKRK